MTQEHEEGLAAFDRIVEMWRRLGERTVNKVEWHINPNIESEVRVMAIPLKKIEKFE